MSYVLQLEKRTTRQHPSYPRSTVFSRLRRERDPFVTLLPEAKEKYYSSPK